MIAELRELSTRLVAALEPDDRPNLILLAIELDAAISGLAYEASSRATDADGERLYRAFMLAPDIRTAEALLRGETVPLDRLRGEWVARFGLKAVA